MERVSERDLISRYLAPLADPQSSFGLRDDAAWLRAGLERGLVVTTDALVAGVHFFEEDAPGAVAFKALAVNVSDLAAKGADPHAYLLTLALPDAPTHGWAREFADGLAQAQKAFGISLIGGDTVKARGAWWLSVTAFGQPGERGMVQRGTARAGDWLYASGTLGDAALGLRLRQDAAAYHLSDDQREMLLHRYLMPQPRLGLIPALRECASAAMDISDGLAIDLGRMCAASGVSAAVETVHLPLSEAAAHILGEDAATLDTIITGGDDYEILATVPPGSAAQYERLAAAAQIRVTRIGTITDGASPPVFLDHAGEPLHLRSPGFEHF